MSRAASLIVIIGAVAAQACGSDDPGQPPASSVPSPIASRTPSAASASPPTASAPRLGSGPWRRIADLEGASVSVVAETTHGLIALGCSDDSGNATGGCQRPMGWLSRDGRRWAEVAGLDGEPGVGFAAVADGPAGVLALGAVLQRPVTELPARLPTIWSSSDGARWLQQPLDPVFKGTQFNELAVLEDRYLIYGANDYQTVTGGFRVWASADGKQWESATLPEADGSGGRLLVREGRVLLAGSTCVEVCGPLERPVMFVSNDGASWELAPDQPSFDGAGHIRAVVTREGFTGVGSVGVDDRLRAAVWNSPDGVTWTRDAKFPPAPRVALVDGVETQAGFLVVGQERGPEGTGGPPIGWLRSDDGTWAPAPLTGLETTGLSKLLATSHGILLHAWQLDGSDELWWLPAES